MSGVNSVSNLTRRNWLIDAGLFLSALIAMLSGVYFLYIPSGGYQGGRNPLAQLQIIFERHTWEDLHTWGGIVMVIVATIHLILHWSWFTAMTRRTIKELRGQCGCMNARGRWNLWINVLVAVSFILVAISGLYFFFFPGNKNLPGSTVIFTWNTWDLIHTWSGIVLTSAAVLHFAIHWKWVTKVTRNMWLVATQPVRQSEPASQRSTHLSQS